MLIDVELYRLALAIGVAANDQRVIPRGFSICQAMTANCCGPFNRPIAVRPISYTAAVDPRRSGSGGARVIPHA